MAQGGSQVHRRRGEVPGRSCGREPHLRRLQPLAHGSQAVSRLGLARPAASRLELLLPWQ